MRPLLSITSLMLLGMDTKLVVPEVGISFFLGFFSPCPVLDFDLYRRSLVATEALRCPVLDDILTELSRFIPNLYTAPGSY